MAFLAKPGRRARANCHRRDSAGGGLTAALIKRLRDAGEESPGCAWLVSPWTDLTMSGETLTTKDHIDPIIHKAYLGELADAYLSGEVVSRNPSDERQTSTDGSYFRLDRRPHAGSGRFSWRPLAASAASGRACRWLFHHLDVNPPMGSARNGDMQGLTQLMLLEAAAIRRSSARYRRTSFTEWATSAISKT